MRESPKPPQGGFPAEKDSDEEPSYEPTDADEEMTQQQPQQPEEAPAEKKAEESEDLSASSTSMARITYESERPEAGREGERFLQKQGCAVEEARGGINSNAYHVGTRISGDSGRTRG